MKFFKILAATLALSTLAFGVQKDQIKQVVTDKTYEAISVLTNSALANEQKTAELFKIFDPLFDYNQMAKISLGKRYNTLNAQQQQEFNKAFEQKLKSSYADKLLSYTNQQITIGEPSEPQPKRVFLNATLTSEGKPYEFIYKFYDNNSDWKIYDIEIIGVSVLQTYRSQFADMLESADFNALMQKLSQTTAIEAK